MTISINVSKVSSKGQIVIPKEMRTLFQEGDSVVFIEEDNKVLLKNMKDLEENFKEDLELSKKINEAYSRYDKGEFVSMNKEEFLDELEQW